MPLFSIVTCTRNSAATLPHTLASLAAQRGADFEHIVVDGDSTDGTLGLLRAAGGATRVVEGVTGGISRAMNAGIVAARGEIVAHLHADDYYLHPEVLQRVAERLQADGSDWLFGRIAIDRGGVLEAERFTAPRYSAAALLRRNFVPHPATFVRRAVFERFGGFREDYRLAMDYEFWLRIAPHTRVSQLDEPLAAFRVHPGSASSAQPLAAFAEDCRARHAHAPWWRWPEFALRHGVRRGRMAMA